VKSIREALESISTPKKELDFKGDINVSIRHAVTKKICKNVKIGEKDFAVVEEGMPFEIVINATLVDPPSYPDILVLLNVSLFEQSVFTKRCNVEWFQKPIVIDRITTNINKTDLTQTVSKMVFRAPKEVTSSVGVKEEALLFTVSLGYGRKEGDVPYHDMSLSPMVVDSSKKFFERPSVTVSAEDKFIVQLTPMCQFRYAGQKKIVTKYVETEPYIMMNMKKRPRDVDADDDGVVGKRSKV
jgi:hypothetical protein